MLPKLICCSCKWRRGTSLWRWYKPSWCAHTTSFFCLQVTCNKSHNWFPRWPTEHCFEFFSRKHEQLPLRMKTFHLISCHRGHQKFTIYFSWGTQINVALCCFIVSLSMPFLMHFAAMHDAAWTLFTVSIEKFRESFGPLIKSTQSEVTSQFPEQKEKGICNSLVSIANCAGHWWNQP